MHTQVGRIHHHARMTIDLSCRPHANCDDLGTSGQITQSRRRQLNGALGHKVLPTFSARTLAR